MKKFFNNPHFDVIVLDEKDIFCTSNNPPGLRDGSANEDDASARQRSNPIWD